MRAIIEGLLELPDGSVVEESLGADRYGRGDSRESPRAAGDRRTESERDVGRIRYSTALLRLGGVSQVVTPLPHAVRRHNRLTHSLKVAGLAREIANDLLRRAKHAETSDALEQIKNLGGLDIAACEAGGLSHDLGHAPFAHSTEDLLDDWLSEVEDECGFEGNAQSLRVVSRLEARRPGAIGFGLTAVTLAATAKYPWLRERSSAVKGRKFSAYRADTSSLELAQTALPIAMRGKGVRSLEAAVVDLADDVTYAIHDVQDFVEGGLIDMRIVLDDVTAACHRLNRSQSAAESVEHDPVGFEAVVSRIEDDPRFDLKKFTSALLFVSSWLREELLAASEPVYQGPLDIGVTRRAFSHLIARILSTVEIQSSPLVEGSWVEPSSDGWHQLQVMKLIGRYYVIESPEVVFQERSHVAAVKVLMDSLLDWAKAPHRHSLPQPLRSFVQLSDLGTDDTPELRRAIVDYICTLSDRDCLDLSTSLSGASSPAFSHFSISV